MLKTFRTAALSALVGLSALAGTAAIAQAEGMYLNFGGERGVGVTVNNGRWDDRRDHRRDRWDDRSVRRSFCTPDRAVRKAERLGLRRARVVDVDRRSIDVAGRRHGHRIVMTFARAPHCPVIG